MKKAHRIHRADIRKGKEKPDNFSTFHFYLRRPRKHGPWDFYKWTKKIVVAQFFEGKWGKFLFIDPEREDQFKPHKHWWVDTNRPTKKAKDQMVAMMIRITKDDPSRLLYASDERIVGNLVHE